MVELATRSAIGSPAAQQAVEQIEALLLAQVSQERLYPGAALAVYANGRLVVDLVTGYADTQRALPVDAESLFPMFSGSKPLAAVALW